VDAGANIRAYDPQGMEAAASLLPPIHYAESAYAAAEGADCLVIVTEWNEFRSLDLDRLKKSMKTPAMVDLRNIYKRAEVESQGFAYASVGRL
jgi:UDPglucose 6-dehydrogenase